MADDGYANLLNVDISSVVIEGMKQRAKDYKALTWEVMDVTEKFPHEENTFDYVIDKGTLDAILVRSFSVLLSKCEVLLYR